MDPGQHEPSSIPDLVEVCLRHLEDGRPQEIDSLLREHPQHADAVRKRLSRLREMGLIEVGSDDGETPERLGSFRIVRRLGAGGMGVVYLAVQEPLEREVALKVIRPEQLFFEGARERFEREIEAVARLKHPNIVPVYVGGAVDGVPYFAMEYLEGVSLSQVIENLAGRTPADLRATDLQVAEDLAVGESWEEACLRVIVQVADALDHAHRRGVLHRDVKPSNVMVMPDGRALLLDFGLASTSDSVRITGSRSTLGSLLYMSPEQVDGPSSALDARTDVYSLGVTLYELLTLKVPYQGESPQSTIRHILDAHPRPPRNVNGQVSWDAETVCLKAMERDVGRRYATVADFARDLRNVLERRAIEARRPPLSLRARRWVQRHPTLSVASLLAFVLLVVGPTVFGLQMMASREDLRIQRNKAIAAERTTRNALGEARIARRVAEAAQADAETAQAEAESAQRAAERSKAEAERQRDRAKLNYGKARAAVDFFLREVGSESLENVPQVEPIRRRLLMEALRYYQEFLAENVDDPTLRRETAESYAQTTHIHTILGDHRAALGTNEDRRKLLAILVEDFPDDVNLRKDLARCYTDMAVLHHALGEVVAAAPWYDQAVGLLDETPELASDPRLRVHLARALNNRSNHLCDTGRLPQAVESGQRAVEVLQHAVDQGTARSDESLEYARALGHVARAFTMQGNITRGQEWAIQSLERWRELTQADPDDVTYRTERALAANRVAHNHFTRGENVEAVEPLEESYEILIVLVDEHPDQPNLRWHLGQSLMNLGIVWENQNDEVAAEEFYFHAIEVQSALVEEYPDIPDYASELGGTLSNLSGLRITQGEPEEGLELANEAVEYQTRALRANNGHPLYNSFLTNHHSNQLGAHLMLQDHASAFEVTEILLRRLGPDPVPRRRMLDCLAECIRLARADDGLDDSERDEIVAEYADTALLELERLVLRGDFPLTEIATTPNLAPLRECAAYEEWRSEHD